MGIHTTNDGVLYRHSRILYRHSRILYRHSRAGGNPVLRVRSTLLKGMRRWRMLLTGSPGRLRRPRMTIFLYAYLPPPKKANISPPKKAYLPRLVRGILCCESESPANKSRGVGVWVSRGVGVWVLCGGNPVFMARSALI